jgi:hypothetical protein
MSVVPAPSIFVTVIFTASTAGNRFRARSSVPAPTAQKLAGEMEQAKRRFCVKHARQMPPCNPQHLRRNRLVHHKFLK